MLLRVPLPGTKSYFSKVAGQVGGPLSAQAARVFQRRSVLELNSAMTVSASGFQATLIIAMSEPFLSFAEILRGKFPRPGYCYPAMPGCTLTNSMWFPACVVFRGTLENPFASRWFCARYAASASS